jgi:hypothetical protein
MADNRHLQELLEMGVPWPLAREAVASTALDRDQTHSLQDQGQEDGPEGDAHADQ